MKYILEKIVFLQQYIHTSELPPVVVVEVPVVVVVESEVEPPDLLFLGSTFSKAIANTMQRTKALGIIFDDFQSKNELNTWYTTYLNTCKKRREVSLGDLNYSIIILLS